MVDTSTTPGPPPRGRWRALADHLGGGEPQPHRGPFARWPRAADAVLAVTVFAASLLAVAASAVADGEGFDPRSVGDIPPAAVVLLALAAATLIARRNHPVGVSALLAGFLVLWALAGYGDGQDLALIVAVYSVGRYVGDPALSVAIPASLVALSLLGGVIDPHQRVDVAPTLMAGIIPWYVGRRVRERGEYLALLRERARRLREDQLARTRRAMAEERARIARELHDVVAHQVSMMTVQAGAARTIAGEDPEAALAAMGDIERAGREALGELRHLLGVLRPQGDHSDDLGPQRGLADVPALVDELRRTGAGVTLDVSGPPVELPAAVDLSVYRIVQESLTNIVRHAGPEPTVEITLEVTDGEITVTVANTIEGAVSAPDLPRSGFGMVGMKERVNLLGGTLVAGPRPPDRFVVEARLPRPGRSR